MLLENAHASETQQGGALECDYPPPVATKLDWNRGIAIYVLLEPLVVSTGIKWCHS